MGHSGGRLSPYWTHAVPAAQAKQPIAGFGFQCLLHCKWVRGCFHIQHVLFSLYISLLQRLIICRLTKAHQLQFSWQHTAWVGSLLSILAFPSRHDPVCGKGPRQRDGEFTSGRVLIFIRFTAWRISGCRLNNCLPFEVIRSPGPWYTVGSTAALSQGPMTCWTSPLADPPCSSGSKPLPPRIQTSEGAADVCLPARFRLLCLSFRLLN